MGGFYLFSLIFLVIIIIFVATVSWINLDEKEYYLSDAEYNYQRYKISLSFLLAMFIMFVLIELAQRG